MLGMNWRGHGVYSVELRMKTAAANREGSISSTIIQPLEMSMNR
jgi:hypothetical protein